MTREQPHPAEALVEQQPPPPTDSQPPTVLKSSSYKEESNFPSDLKDFERNALNQLKSKLQEAIAGSTLFPRQEKDAADAHDGNRVEPVEIHHKGISLWGVPLLPSQGAKGVDVVLLKFLRAREFKVNEAFDMLTKTLKWRKESNIDSILDEDFGSDLRSAAYMNGVDRDGHPACYNIFGVFDSQDMYHKTFGTEEKRIEFLRWRLKLMEEGIQKLNMKPGGVSSLLQINDLKNSPGPAKKEIRVATKQALAILQDNYPEMVAKNIFINVPFWYYALNALLSPFLTQRTKSKFVVAHPAKVTETPLKYVCYPILYQVD
ncbi:patellin-4-like [Neltuma alba]|uniref:patellin-4-like n=1 Tax=Neltuma alba TaxID=207710 RepID=UPI0010A51EBC|nr:patellin-4-like [Prosopis alba]